MAIVKQGGTNPHAGQVMTSMGYREPRAPVCTNCRERKRGQLYTINVNGQIVCGDCSGSVGEGVLRQECSDPDNCACGVPRDEPDPS